MARNALGRGLGALIRDPDPQPAPAVDGGGSDGNRACSITFGLTAC